MVRSLAESAAEGSANGHERCGDPWACDSQRSGNPSIRHVGRVPRRGTGPLRVGGHEAHAPAGMLAARSHFKASCSSVKYLLGHCGRGSPRRPWAMTRSTDVLPRIAKAVTVTASLKTRTASRLTCSTPVTCSKTAQPAPPVRVRKRSRTEVPSAAVI